MEPTTKILVTGGSGLLGGELRGLLPDAEFPPRSVFDVTDFSRMQEYFENKSFRTVLHAAALTSPPRVDKEPMQALQANIIGTANLVRLCLQHAVRLVYVSTDYVFKGDAGNYSEEDAVFPINKYAWSKLGGECAVRLYDHSLIIRTSFGPNVFPYEKAFVDQWTSRESVKVIAGKIAKLAGSDLTGIIHIGGQRRTVMEYALSLNPQKPIAPLSIKEISFKAPADTSLNVSKYQKLFN
jgi:dTDP-4-dehydrorhamnose reductase